MHYFAGFHCSDLVMQAGQSDASVQAVQNLGMGTMFSYFWSN